MDRLIRENCYRTDPEVHGRRVPMWPSVAFHLRMLMIYWRNNRLAVHGRYGGDQWALSSFDVLRLLEKVGVNFSIENLDTVYGLDEPCVYIANHMSTLETFVLPCLIQPAGNTTFIVKESLTRFPVFGPVMRSRDPIAVGRKDPREDLRNVMEGGLKRLGSGTSLIVFPQTTRSDTFDPSRFNSIGVKLAGRAGAPALPVALKTDAWGKGRLIKDFGPIRPEKTVHICFGDPMPVAGSGKEAHEKIVGFIRHKLSEWEGDD